MVLPVLNGGGDIQGPVLGGVTHANDLSSAITFYPCSRDLLAIANSSFAGFL